MTKAATPLLERPIQTKGWVGFIQRTVRGFREMVSDIYYLMVL